MFHFFFLQHTRQHISGSIQKGSIYIEFKPKNPKKQEKRKTKFYNPITKCDLWSRDRKSQQTAALKSYVHTHTITKATANNNNNI